MKLIAFTTLALTLAASTANAQNVGPYIGLGVGATDMQNTRLETPFGNLDYHSDIGVSGSAYLGYKLNSYLRIEAEATAKHNDVNGSGSSGEFDSYAGMGNLYIDIPTGGKLTPYIGAGAGYAYITDTDVHSNKAAYQGMAGLSYALTPKTDLSLGYKYFSTFSSPEYNAIVTNIKAPYEVHSVELGLRFGL